jgi:acyl carrier protein
MNSRQVSSRLQELFGAIIGGGTISPVDMTRDNSPQWDSLGHINIISAMEEEFGIVFTDDEILNIKSFTDALLAAELRANGCVRDRGASPGTS